MLLSVDPGLRACGVALWECGALVQAVWVRSPSKAIAGPDAWQEMAHAVYYWVNERVKASSIYALAFEQPGAYGTDTPKRTLDLQNLVAVDAWICSMFPEAEYMRYFPRDWKGTLKPEVICNRAWGALTAAEQFRVVLPAKSYQHNVLDAVGIGLKALGRFESVRRVDRK